MYNGTNEKQAFNTTLEALKNATQELETYLEPSKFSHLQEEPDIIKNNIKNGLINCDNLMRELNKFKKNNLFINASLEIESLKKQIEAMKNKWEAMDKPYTNSSDAKRFASKLQRDSEKYASEICSLIVQSSNPEEELTTTKAYGKNPNAATLELKRQQGLFKPETNNTYYNFFYPFNLFNTCLSLANAASKQKYLQSNNDDITEIEEPQAVKMFPS